MSQSTQGYDRQTYVSAIDMFPVSVLAQCSWRGQAFLAHRRMRLAAIQVLRDAFDAGVRHIDTSDFYGPHITNQIIKKALILIETI